jgi:hypothetical protein
MKLAFAAFLVSIVSLVHAKSHASENFTGVVKVECDGINSDNLDDLSATVFAQALEESYDALDDIKKKGTYINVDWVCKSCVNDDRYKPAYRRPRLANEGGQGTSGLEFNVDWICGDMCPGDDFLATSFLGSSLTPRTGTALDVAVATAVTSSVRGVLVPVKSDVNVAEWEKHLIRALIDTRRTDFRAGKSCKITVVPGVVLDTK